MPRFGDDEYGEAIAQALGGEAERWALTELRALQQKLREAQDDLRGQFDQRHTEATTSGDWDGYEAWKAQAQKYLRLLVLAVGENGQRIQERQGERSRSRRAAHEERLDRQWREAASLMFDIVEGRLQTIDEIADRGQAWLVDHREYQPAM